MKKGLKILIALLLSLPFGEGWGGAVNAQNINTIAGNGTAGYCGDGGSALSACFNNQWGIAVDKKGNIYVGDRSNNRIRKINTAGIITTFAGNGGTGSYGGDGGIATNASLNYCPGVAVDKIGNVYITDVLNLRIRKVDTAGIITTVIGNGTGGFSGDGGQATNAQISGVIGITVDTFCNIYIGDNNRIRKVNTSGIINTIAGTGVAGFTGDGGYATNAELEGLNCITVDLAGNIVMDNSDGVSICKIRKINTAGIITTIAGDSCGYSGDGGLATSCKLQGGSVVVDKHGNIFIADNPNYRVRMIGTNGIINTVVGNGTMGFSGDGGNVLNAELDGPLGIALDSAGYLYLSDTWNNRIRKVDNSVGIEQYAGNSMQVNIYPNPAKDVLNLELKTQNGIQNTNLQITDMLGNIIRQVSTNSSQFSINIADLSDGVYFIQVSSADKVYITKFIVSK